jgi:hypothetical protein
MAKFQLSRSTVVAAQPAQVHTLIDDFKRWRSWSPWEDRDANLQRTYSGADSGVGARYAWRGNRKAGEGNMEVTSSTPQRIEIALRFIKPMAASNHVSFDLRPAAAGTEVTWTMAGERNGVMELMGKLFSDKMIGRDFENGLAQLKRSAESGGASATTATP